MARRVSRIASMGWVLVTGVLSVGCGARMPARYVEPKAEQPHALVTVRLEHELLLDKKVEGVVRLNGRSIQLPAGNRRAHSTSVALRVPAGVGTWELEQRFFHPELRPTLTVVPVFSRKGGRLDWTPSLRSQLEVTRVDTAACDQAATYALEDGGTYAIRLSMDAKAACRLSCVEHRTYPDGDTAEVPCRRAGALAAGSNLASPGSAARGVSAPAVSAAEVNRARAKERTGGTAVTLGIVGLSGAALLAGYAAWPRDGGYMCESDDQECAQERRDAEKRRKDLLRAAAVSGAGSAVLLGAGLALRAGSKEKGASIGLRPTARGAQLSVQGKL